MAKKKICTWMNGKERGGIRFEHNKILACCQADVEIVPQKDYSQLTYEDIVIGRQKLFKEINENPNHFCHKCAMLEEKDESEIEVDKVKLLIYMPYTNCNFRCRYCYIPKESLAKKPDYEKANILPVLENLKKQDILKDNFELVIGGGEPMLLIDVAGVVKFLSENFKNPVLKFLSNASIIPNKEKFYETMKSANNLCTKIYTSIDAGTKETYAYLRGNNCFEKVCNNLKDLAANNIYKYMTLKYILMPDNSNLSDKDIFGFLTLLKEVSRLNPNTTLLCIDADYRNNQINAEHITEKMLSAAGKIYWGATKVLNIKPIWLGNRLCEASEAAMEDIRAIAEYANNYENMPKTREEINYIKDLKSYIKRPSTLQQIFSVRNENKHKVLRVLGVKMKFKKPDKVHSSINKNPKGGGNLYV